MTTNRKNSISAGVLLLLAIIVGALGASTLGVLGESDYLVRVGQSENGIIFGVLMIAAMAFACVGIAISMYPVLKKHSPALAIGAVALRAIEAVLFLVAGACLLPVITLSKEYLLGAASAETLQSIADTLLVLRANLSTGLAAIAFCLGAMMYYIIIFKAKLLPRWLSIWGLIAISMHLVSATLVLFGVDSFSTVSVVLNVPIALQELTMGLWLIIKGFNVKEDTIKKIA